MKMEQVLELVRAGYTKQEIAGLELGDSHAIGTDADSPEVPPTAPDVPPASSTSPPSDPPIGTASASTETSRQVTMQDFMNEFLRQTRLNNIGSSTLPPTEQPEDILASIINPKEDKT
jgi:hypothetical protein